MAEREKFDAIVVGAGPAGASAAIAMSGAGLSVVLIERGEYPGAKNVMGGVMYGAMVAELVPGFWREAPIERVIVEERIWLATEDSAVTLGYRGPARQDPPNAFTVLRATWDRWFAAKAEEAGAFLVTETVVEDLIRDDAGKVIGVRTGREDGDLYAGAVVIADGVNSFLVQRAGLERARPEPNQVALVAKEIIALPPEVIESRFVLGPGEGATIEVYGAPTREMAGYGFIYTNRDSLSIGIGALISHFMQTKITPYDLLEGFKSHPLVGPLIAGGEVKEYAAHAIPEGGYRAMPRLYGDGVLVAGDAAMMVNALHREGSNLAQVAGRIAGETIAAAKSRGDFSAGSLAEYERRLNDTFVIKDLRKYAGLPHLADRHPELLHLYPRLANESVHEMLTVDGVPKREKQKKIWRQIRARRRPTQILRDLYEGWKALR